MNLQLVPNQPNAATVPVPTYEHIIGLIQSGVLDVHPSRLPLTKNDLIIAIRNIQARFAQSLGQPLVTGWGGWWSEAAWEALGRWLCGVKRSRSQPSQLALPAPVPMLALPPPPSPSASSASSSTTSSEESGGEAPQEEVEEEPADDEEDGDNDEDTDDKEDADDENADSNEDADDAEDELPHLDDLSWMGADWEDLSTSLAYIAEGLQNDEQKALWAQAVSSMDKIYQAQRR